MTCPKYHMQLVEEFGREHGSSASFNKSLGAANWYMNLQVHKEEWDKFPAFKDLTAHRKESYSDKLSVANEWRVPSSLRW